jgi:aspartate/methionine/tyrosine aminotransferase
LKQLGPIARHAEALLDTNRALVNQFLDSRRDLETVRPEYGTIMFPRLRSGRTEQLIEVLREKYETSVVPGRFFEMPEHFRLGLPSDTENLKGGLERLGLALDEIFDF